MYEITILEEVLYTKVIVKGERTPLQKTDAAMAWTEVANYCQQNKTKKLLIISKLRGSISQISSFDISNSLEQFGLRKDIKIAFVDKQKQSFEANSFSTKFANNKGFDVKIFMNNNNAVSWLIQ